MKMVRAFPGFNPLGDNTHMSPYLNDASAAFMYTLLSGRCPGRCRTYAGRLRRMDAVARTQDRV